MKISNYEYKDQQVFICFRSADIGHNVVNIQDVDVPGFVKRLNRNMKRVFKPKKVVERITKRLKAQKD